MPARTLPGIGLLSDWDLGENGWKAGMDANLKKLSTLTVAVVESVANALPLDPAEGAAYISLIGANANSIALWDQGAWTFYSPRRGQRAYVTALNKVLEFAAAGWVDPFSGLALAVATAQQAALDAQAALAATEANTSGATTFALRAQALTFHPEIAPSWLEYKGWLSVGDGGGGLFKKVVSEPAHSAKMFITLEDTVTIAWYELVDTLPKATQFGGTGVIGAVDASVDINHLMAYAKNNKAVEAYLVGGDYQLNAPIRPLSGVSLRGNRQSTRITSYTGIPILHDDSGGLPLIHSHLADLTIINHSSLYENAEVTAMKLGAMQYCNWERLTFKGFRNAVLQHVQPTIVFDPDDAAQYGIDYHNVVFNTFTSFEVDECRIGQFFRGGPTYEAVTNVVTHNLYTDMTFRKVRSVGMLSDFYHDNDRWMQGYMMLKGEGAVAYSLGIAGGAQYRGVSAHHFFGPTIVTDPEMDFENLYGFALGNAPGCLIFGLPADRYWPTNNQFVYNPLDIELWGVSSYMHTPTNDSSVSAITNRIGFINQSTLTERSGKVIGEAGWTAIAINFLDVANGNGLMYAAPDNVFVQPYSNTAGVRYYVDETTITHGGFVIRFEEPLPGNVAFRWNAKVTQW